ncbi:hypothetical protein CRM22_010258 [Opisthorchis felineus]|uniref:Uncharacterized protein n=1 Tax=Opisthorchis felineus TaxID=147828 RepID=A0A4S2L005_OPIFE|nr:hypothetical protein CRM22_010258 [Opisthorchis felineus]
MTLDDLFAKKAKKKTKKHNPQDLLEKLTKEVSKQHDQEGDVNSDNTKAIASLVKDDEWETIEDDEKDIDLQTIQLGNLALNASGEPKQQSKDKSEKEGSGAAEEEKKVWGTKIPEAPVVEEPAVEEKPTPKPGVYIPVHLRQGGSRVPKEPKPDVESTADFPTLGAAIPTEPVPSKVQSKAEREEEASWSQAGAPRKPTRTSEMLPIAVNPAPSSYVSPGLRKGGSSSLVAPRTESTFDSRPPRDEFSHRNESSFGSRRSEAFTPRDAPSTFSTVDGWSRGQTIVRDSTTPNKSAITNPISLPSRTTAVNSGAPGGEGGGGWQRGEVMKTFRDSDREKAQFELVQSNRFAGLSET